MALCARHAGATAGIIKTAAFANSSSGGRYVSADGAWLSAPDAALIGEASDGSRAAVLLALSAPVYDSATQASAALWNHRCDSEERACRAVVPQAHQACCNHGLLAK